MTIEYLTTEEAARLLGVATTTIRSYARRGHLTPVPIDRRTNLYHRAEVERLITAPPRPGRPPRAA